MARNPGTGTVRSSFPFVSPRASPAAQRITLKDFTKRADVSRSALYNWIDAKRDLPVPGLFKIADVLRIPASELMIRAESCHRSSDA
ncbi:helix-turn-helix domain-containing protein [Brachybacterium sp. AOP29-B2-41]|uniref:helix-turn-helix domain-containing protein n=1 Tax=Brachybacterium sp. AOP29-B2-41 TaxID=3457704 RepID=UPI004034725E